MSKPTDAEALKAAAGFLRIVFWALVATAAVQGYRHGIDYVVLNLVMAAIVQQFRFEVITLGGFGLLAAGLKEGVEKARLKAIGSRRKSQADPFDGDPFGDVPFMDFGAGKDSDNEKKGE